MQTRTSRFAILIASISMGTAGIAMADAKGDFELNLKISEKSTVADVGLPAYPGSKPYVDTDQTSSGGNFGLSMPAFGIKVAAINMETSDAVERVVTYYRRALAKYGDVLECKHDAARPKTPPPAEGSNKLTCDFNDGDANSVVYKAGTKKNQRVVSVKPHGSGTRFALVRVEIRE